MIAIYSSSLWCYIILIKLEYLFFFVEDITLQKLYIQSGWRHILGTNFIWWSVYAGHLKRTEIHLQQQINYTDTFSIFSLQILLLTYFYRKSLISTVKCYKGIIRAKTDIGQKWHHRHPGIFYWVFADLLETCCFWPRKVCHGDWYYPPFFFIGYPENTKYLPNKNCISCLRQKAFGNLPISVYKWCHLFRNIKIVRKVE